ncbi:hypothetical protein F5Y15DRAFT_218405 [Xylariaceae sp. FL0016]|nr:hypothetical protein F5Y15DRAFT_218405 [Xylariaceae sp. FL0016]
MSFRFSGLSSSPSTPERSSRNAFAYSADHPSTTPAGPPPPSSVASFTPVGEPSPSFLQSSIGAMSGITGKPKAPNFGRPNLRNPAKSSSKGTSAPLARSLRGSRGPSSLSKEYLGEDEDSDDDDDMPVNRGGTFSMPYDDETEGEDTEVDNADATEDDEDEQDSQSEEMDDDQGEAMGDDDMDYDVEDELLRELAGTDEDADQMLITTTAADERALQEADDLFRASMRSKGAQKRDFKFSTLAKDLYSHGNFADVFEPDDVVLQTEDVIAQLYDEGVGPDDDFEKMDHTLSRACAKLLNTVWLSHLNSLPEAEEEHDAKVGPSSGAPAFEKAMFLATLVFRIHHTQAELDEFGGSKEQTLPAILFAWQDAEHNLDHDQFNIITRHRPAPAAHPLFWQSVFNTLVRGDVASTIRLLRGASWEAVKKSPRGEALYNGQALQNIRRSVEDLCLTMESCPCVTNKSWDIRSSDWTLFRLKARAAKEALISFAEGKDRSSGRFNDSDLADSTVSRRSLSGLARKAESQIPWDIYENMQSLYAILIGDADAILAAAQDWCEATISLFGWWDDGHNMRQRGLSHSKSLQIANEPPPEEELFDRLAFALQTATENDFHFDSNDPVEVGVACAFEGNTEAIIGFLRLWSLPVASTVAEIASLGRWLPLPEPQNLINMNVFDKEELEVLGMDKSTGLDEKLNIKDETLVQYARSLRNRRNISGMTLRGRVSREGWELAVQVVGRMDLPEQSEQMVQELLQNVLASVDEDSRETVDKIWKLLNNLGMINFAEDTAETFADVLSKETHRFGETLWYYALAHRPGKVRDVLNTLMSISLVESTAYPQESELDDVLRELLVERTTTLEQYAKQDLEAAELLGKMLSGYATLRKFYEIRDGNGKSTQMSLLSRQQAAAALTAVIASADDNIRGGLYDDTRDAVVSEDFLLALLGEASVFVGHTPPVITLEQIDILLKATEDIETVGSRVYDAADEFFKVVLSSGHGKGSTPASLLGQSTSSLSGSFMMTGSSMIASQLHQSVVKSGTIKGPTKRAWDWRSSIYAGSSSADVLKKIRLALTKDLANLWLEQADSVIL